MKPSTRDGIESRSQDVKEEIQKKAGPLANDSNLQAEGHAAKMAGEVQKGIAKTAEMHEAFAPDLGKE